MVGWKGGKRRLLKRLRPWFPVEGDTLYAEPFVGMGALLLDLRGSGWRGEARVADDNPEVRDFWRMVHEPEAGGLLAMAAQDLLGRFSDSPGESDWWAMLEEHPVDDADRVARFLWLVNYAYANSPVRWTGERWYRARGAGTKLRSAAKWGKTFPWSACVRRLREVVEACGGSSVRVYDGAGEVPLVGAKVYADPPYLGRSDYVAGGDEMTDWAEVVLGWGEREHVVLSETRCLNLPPGWLTDEASVVARASAGSGATGRRREALYVSPVARKACRPL